MATIQDMVKRCYDSEPQYEQMAPGVPKQYKEIKTVRDLLDISYKMIDIKTQLRYHILHMIRSDTNPYQGIIGFDEDIVPALNRAILAGHDMILVGQMGQAKTRIAEIISSRLLSPMPILRDSITNDTPMILSAERLATLLEGSDIDGPPNFEISPDGAETLKNDGLDARIRWATGQERSKFVVATPDMSAKDLCGYVDVAKMARTGSDMYGIESYSPGHLMQARHGILCIDELPVLDPRKQVALLSVLQEGRFTTGAYPVTFMPNILLVCTANPVDYTHTGRIIEPLRDRLRSIIYTRYPDTTQNEMDIIQQEADVSECVIPDIILYLLSKMVRNVRNSPLVNQDKGVSVRFGIHGLELLIAEAQRVRPDDIPCPRISDFGCLSQAARFELIEIDDTIQNRLKVWQDIMDQTIDTVCSEMTPDMSTHDDIKTEFGKREFHVSQVISWDSYVSHLKQFPILHDAILHMDKTISGETIHTGPIATELTLECLRRCRPPVLERRDSKYAAV